MIKFSKDSNSSIAQNKSYFTIKILHVYLYNLPFLLPYAQEKCMHIHVYTRYISHSLMSHFNTPKPLQRACTIEARTQDPALLRKRRPEAQDAAATRPYT